MTNEQIIAVGKPIAAKYLKQISNLLASMPPDAHPWPYETIGDVLMNPAIVSPSFTALWNEAHQACRSVLYRDATTNTEEEDLVIQGANEVYDWVKLVALPSQPVTTKNPATK